MELKLEVVVVPVSDVDRAKDFYKRLGFREDVDYAGSDGYRIVQLTPPGSPCSIIFGNGVTSAKPGSIDSMVFAVTDIVAYWFAIAATATSSIPLDGRRGRRKTSNGCATILLPSGFWMSRPRCGILRRSSNGFANGQAHRSLSTMLHSWCPAIPSIVTTASTIPLPPASAASISD